VRPWEEDPMAGHPGGGAVGPSNSQLAAAQKMQVQRQLAAQKRRDRRGP
jgi:hypothetical protein